MYAGWPLSIVRYVYRLICLSSDMFIVRYIYLAILKMKNTPYSPYSRKYFRMNSTASTYIRGDIPLVLPAPM